MKRKDKRVFPEAKPQLITMGKLAIVVKTRSPLESFQMLRQGQPIDVALGYYVENGMLEKDLYLMDHVEKLHALAKFKELKLNAQADVDYLIQQESINQSLNKLKDDKDNQVKTEEPGGSVS